MHSEVGGPREGVVGRHGARIATTYHFPGHVTVSDGSVGSDCMGAGFTWMDSSLKRCGSERIGRDEEGTSSGRADLGGYTAILKHTPDTQDLVTVTDSEVLS